MDHTSLLALLRSMARQPTASTSTHPRKGDNHTHPTIAETIDIYARWTGYGEPKPTPDAPVGRIHVYELTTRPPRPLEIGTHVRIAATSPIVYHAPVDIYSIKRSDTYDPHIVGRIVDSSGLEGGGTVVGVKNECRKNVVHRAELIVPNLLAPWPARASAKKRMWTTEETLPVDAEDAMEERIVIPAPPECGAQACTLETYDYGEAARGLGEFRLVGSIDGRTLAARRRRLEQNGTGRNKRK